MAKEKKLSHKQLSACRDLISEGSSKKDVSRAVGMSPQTLKKKLDQDELEGLRKQVAEYQSSESKMLPFNKRKKDA